MKAAGSLLWLVVVVALVFMAQRMAPLVRVDDPDAVPEEDVRGFLGFGGDSGSPSPSATRAVSNAVRGIACATCKGTRQIDCPTCNGSGQVESVQKSNCQQCNGTGVYRSRVSSRSGAPCAFCRGTGQTETRQMVTCRRCGGHGRIACTACQGSGENSSPSP